MKNSWRNLRKTTQNTCKLYSLEEWFSAELWISCLPRSSELFKYINIIKLIILFSGYSPHSTLPFGSLPSLLIDAIPRCFASDMLWFTHYYLSCLFRFRLKGKWSRFNIVFLVNLIQLLWQFLQVNKELSFILSFTLRFHQGRRLGLWLVTWFRQTDIQIC